MANTCYDNFFLSNEIEDQYQSHLDLQQFCTVDNNLTGVAGMVRKIHKYKATDGTEKLTMGNGNTKTIEAGYTEKEYRIPSTFPSICTISGNGVGMMFPPMSRKQSTVTSWNWPKVGQTRMKPLWFVSVRWKAACWGSPVFWILPTPRSTVKRRTVP